MSKLDEAKLIPACTASFSYSDRVHCCRQNQQAHSNWNRCHCISSTGIRVEIGYLLALLSISASSVYRNCTVYSGILAWEQIKSLKNIQLLIWFHLDQFYLHLCQIRQMILSWMLVSLLDSAQVKARSVSPSHDWSMKFIQNMLFIDMVSYNSDPTNNQYCKGQKQAASLARTQPSWQAIKECLHTQETR